MRLSACPSEGRGKVAQFIPIRFEFTNKLGKDEKLLLAFDAFVLSEMLGRRSASAKSSMATTTAPEGEDFGPG